MKKPVRTFRIDLQKWENLKDLADRLGVTRGFLIRGAIEVLLNNPDLAASLLDIVEEVS